MSLSTNWKSTSPKDLADNWKEKPSTIVIVLILLSGVGAKAELGGKVLLGLPLDFPYNNLIIFWFFSPLLWP